MEIQNINNIQYTETNYRVLAEQIFRYLGIIEDFNEDLLSEKDNNLDKVDSISNDLLDDVFIRSDGKIEINSKFPCISEDLLKELTPKGIKFEIIYKPLDVNILNSFDSKPTIIRIDTKNWYHTIFYDGNKIYDSWYDCYQSHNEDIDDHKYYYSDDIYICNHDLFYKNAPQQNCDEGYCDLFAITIARLHNRGYRINSFNKKIQNIKIKQEQSKFMRLNSEMHINEIEYNDIPTLN